MEEGKSKFESLSEDLLVEIFLMMAENIKAVVRLRSVSKSWRRLVNSCCLPRLTCKGELAKVDDGSEFLIESPRFNYPINGGVVVEKCNKNLKGLLLNRLSSSPLVYCVSNLDATSWVMVNGPPDFDGGTPEFEYAALSYISKYRLLSITVQMRVNCSKCHDKIVRHILFYNSNLGGYIYDWPFEQRLCHTCYMNT